MLLRLINGNIDGITIIGLVTAGNKASPTAKTRQGTGTTTRDPHVPRGNREVVQGAPDEIAGVVRLSACPPFDEVKELAEREGRDVRDGLDLLSRALAGTLYQQ